VTTATGRASSRLRPSFFDPQRHPLAGLAKAVEATLAEDLAPGGGAIETIVDFGAGDRPYEPLLARLGARYVAVDIEGAPDVLAVPGQPLPLAAGSADLVVSFQVLEHVWDLDWYLGEARRILAPGGRLLLSTHGTWPFHPVPTDFRRWTRPGLEREIRSRGFEVVRVRDVVGPLAYSTQMRLLGMQVVLRRLPVVGPLVAGLVAAVMNVRMILEDLITPAAFTRDNACVYCVLARKT
jgi:SAM-dependent methyltransferase